MSRWLLLAHQLPAKPSNARVKTWRRLQEVGAVPVRNSVYVLPNTEACREDFEWIRAEIVALGGGATVFESDAVDRSADLEIEDAFRRARDADYVQLAKDAKTIRKTVDRRGIRAVSERLAAIRRIDFFHAAAGDRAADAVAALERQAGAAVSKEIPVRTSRSGFVNRRWVTRPRPGVDRMASAWLIRRFIDPDAAFGFVPQPSADEVAFDMYTGDFSHLGDKCTFEVLAERFGITDSAVVRLAEIVHDLDMKDNRYSAPEAPAVGRMIDGLRQLHADDAMLLEQGIAMFEALARSYESTKDGNARVVRPRSRRRGKRT
jgi:hypothetical protein